MLPYTALDMLRVMRRFGEDDDVGDDQSNDRDGMRIAIAPDRPPHDSNDGPGFRWLRLKPAGVRGPSVGRPLPAGAE